MVSTETLLSYPYWKLSFIFHTYASDKQLGAVISQNIKPIAFSSRRLIKPHRNYTTTEKELLAIMECLKPFRGIIFGYEINIFSYNNNLLCAATLSEYQRVMHWRLIIEESGPIIQHIAGVDNIVAYTLSRITYTPIDRYNTSTSKSQCCVIDFFTIVRLENN